jgi:ribosome modulation factor
VKSTINFDTICCVATVVTANLRPLQPARCNGCNATFEEFATRRCNGCNVSLQQRAVPTVAPLQRLQRARCNRDRCVNAGMNGPLRLLCASQQSHSRSEMEHAVREAMSTNPHNNQNKRNNRNNNQNSTEKHAELRMTGTLHFSHLRGFQEERS